MAKKCWYIAWTNCDGSTRSGYYCASTVEWLTSGHNCGNGVLYSPDLGWNAQNSSERAATFFEVSCRYCSSCCTDSVSPAQPHDCVNGGCVPAKVYGTPGFYASLTACQSGCAKNSPCNGECVDAAELAQLQQAVGNVKSRVCG